jgi:hypothetical protein
MLDEEWLRAWGYYPNHYKRAELIETWRSIARIFGDSETQ